MREEASTVSWTIRLGTGPIESGKQLRGRRRVSSTGDDLSRNGAKFRRTGVWSEREIEFTRDWRGIWLGVEWEHWQKSSSWEERGEGGRG